MERLDYKRIAIDASVISWKACQGRQSSVQRDPEKRRDYQAIEELFDLQERGRIVLVGPDQVDREVKKTSDEAKRVKLIETLKLCKEKYYLTRFYPLTKSKRESGSRGKSGINLIDGAYWVTDDDKRKIEEYITVGTTSEEMLDLEVLATVAIAGVRVFVTVDYNLLRNNRIKDFVKQKDDIEIYCPSEIVQQLHSAGVVKRLMKNLLLHLTKLYLRVIGARVKEVSVLMLPDGREQEVVVFSSKDLFILGQVTLFGTVVIHEAVFQTERLLDYVVVHEAAHKRQWYRHFIFPLFIIFWPAAMAMFIVTVLIPISAIASQEPRYLLALAFCLPLTAVLAAVPCIYSWFLEFNADCQAIRILGMPAILEALADARALSKRSLYMRIVARMTHPPIRWTFWVCRLLYRDLRNMTGRRDEPI